MTERDESILRVMSEPVSHVTSLTDRDKAAVRAALTELRELREDLAVRKKLASEATLDLLELEG
jgi:hypothetical protein